MAQYTNLNVSPYFDDFDSEKNYQKILFKPGYPVQARELTTLQTTLQNQIEKFGKHFFTDGEQIIPGGTTYFKNFHCVQIDASYGGVSVGEYIKELENNRVVIIGERSGVTARVEKVITNLESENNNFTLYVSYIDSNINNNSSTTFIDGEQLITTYPLQYQSLSITPNTPFARTISNNASLSGSAFGIANGVYFIRGNFVEISEHLIILDQYSNTPNYRIGFLVNEELITSDQDFSLNDNARGFTNYAAPGADRFKISCNLYKKPLNDFNDDNFIELVRVVDGTLNLEKQIKNEKSENYYLNPFNVTINESLNDEISNNGIFSANRLTYNGNIPSEQLLTYKISPGKCVIDGQTVDNLDTVYLDAPKPRETKELINQKINYFTGPTLSINRFSGSPLVGFATDYVLSMQSERVGFTTFFTSGYELGLCRVYDFKLKDDEYKSIPESNIFDISLYDIQLFTYLTINENIDLNKSTFIRGKSSGSTAYVKNNVSNSNIITVYQVVGDFKVGEQLIFDDSEIPSRIVTSIDKKTIEDVKSLYANSGSNNIFTADVLQKDEFFIGNVGITSESPTTILPSSTTATATVSSITIGSASTAPLSMVGVVTSIEPTITYTTFTSTSQDVTSSTVGIASTAPLSMVGVVTALGFSQYTGALNENPSISWVPPSLPVGFTTRSFTLIFEDLSTGDIHWHVDDIPASGPYTISAGATNILNATIKQNYIMSGDGVFGSGSITPSLLAIGPEYITGLSSIGYAGPQPPLGENHFYRLSLTTNLNETSTPFTTSFTVGFGSTSPSVPSLIDIPASYTPTYSDNAVLGISSIFPTYLGAENLNPDLSWSVGPLPTGVAVSSYTIYFQNLSLNQVLWHVTDIPSTTLSINSGITSIPSATIQKNYLMTTSGTVGVGSITPSLVAIGASYISGISTVGYSGPQPPRGEYHTYRLTLSASLSGSRSSLTTSITVGFGTTGSTIIAPTSPIIFPDNSNIIIDEVRGISTCFPSSTQFASFIKLDDIVSFTKIGDILPTYGKVVGIGTTTFNLESTSSVPGVCNQGITNSDIIVENVRIVKSKFSSSSDNSFYTPLPKQNIENINLLNSKIIIRKQYNLVSTAGTTNTISCLPEESFLPYNKNRYSLSYQGGLIEPLRADQINILPGQKSLFIDKLSQDGNCTLTVALEKINVTHKVKIKNSVGSIIIDKSKNNSSSTLTDGLVYGNYPYGTRIQDREICLNVPDVIKVYAVYESKDTSDPSAPLIILNNIDSPSNSTLDFKIGETITGQTTKSKAIVVEKNTSNQISFVYLNSNKFLINEKIISEETNIEADITLISEPSKNITSYYKFNDGQNQNFYNYSSIIRTKSYNVPTKKIKVYYLNASYNSSDNGDITVVNSYRDFDYKNEIRSINNIRNTDIIDIRPKVSNYSVIQNQSSPFEFESRKFNRFSSSSFNILASDESIDISYSFYLPRIDKIYLTKNGLFEVKYGYDSESSQITDITDNSLEIATISLSPYLYNVNQSIVDITRHKKYTIQDVKSIDNRLKNIEKSTSLSLLEIETNSLFIRDINGSNRLKVGFFVDDFGTLETQELSIGIKNSIDIENKELRPSHNTTCVDLILGSELISGITSTTDLNGDYRYLSNIQGKSIKKTGDLITLDYTEQEWIKNPFATKSEKITPFYESFWQGTLELNPSSDTWLDESKITSKNIKINSSYLGFSEWFMGTEDLDINTGFIPVQWNSWKALWSGIDSSSENSVENSTNYSVNNYLGNGSISEKLNQLNYAQDQFLNGFLPSSIKIEKNKDTFTNEESGTISISNKLSKNKSSIREVLNVSNISNKIVSNDITFYVRSRNIEFIGKKLKPYTRLYAYFDGIDVNRYIVPKLLEISMSIGSFNVGETVIGYSASTKEPIFKFRVATLNHKNGPYNNPTEVYELNPYNKIQSLPSTYTLTSEIVNIDTYSLSMMNGFDFYGYPEEQMLLKGQTSGSEAIVQNIRLITDKNGYVCGSLFINNPNSNKVLFETGEKTLTLTSNLSNSKSVSAITTIAEESFNSQGIIEYEYDSVLSTRTIKIQRKTLKDFDSLRKTNLPIQSSRSSKIYANTSNYDETNGLYFDPLAQTFYVNEETGIFVNKLDIYFRSKDESLPITCQIRTVVNGSPSDIILPFSEITLDSNNINISNDSSQKTTFNFVSPVYLKGNTEYCIVLLSNSPNYEVWISRNGEENIFENNMSINSPSGFPSKISLLGKLFKPQNANKWQGSKFESLKFTLYRASFVNDGFINFYNPDLTISNNQIQNLVTDPLLIESKKIRITLSNSISDVGINTGQLIQQVTTDSIGTLIGIAGSSYGNLKVINSGIGYTPSIGIATYTNVSMVSLTGNGRDAKATITIINGSISTTNTFITDGGFGYQVGDILTPQITNLNNLRSSARLSVGIITSLNQLIVDKVQGTFLTGVGNSITYTLSSGITTQLNFSSGGVFPTSPIIIDNDGLHFKVSQRNHGLNSSNNFVKISNVITDINPTFLSADLLTTDTQINIQVDTNFDSFENLGISTTNHGYILIDDEIISYDTIIGSTTLTITNRGVDGTQIKYHKSGTPVYKYELGGVSLRRINTTHDLSLSNLDKDLDFYHVKIDMSANGENRTGNLSKQDLFLNQNKVCGGQNVYATKNIQFESITPIIQTLVLPGTNIVSSLRTISGTSVGSTTGSYIDQGYQDFSIDGTTFFDSPKMIASKVNEDNRLSSLPGNKSLNLLMNMSSFDERISPVIDLDRVSLILTENRLNNPNIDYSLDGSVNSLYDDLHAFQYVTKEINLFSPATGLKVIVSAHINLECDIRAFYSINNDGEKPVFIPFPGFNNLTSSGEIINLNNNDGTSDIIIQPSLNFAYESEGCSFAQYEFTANKLQSFRDYRIKLVFRSSNQAFVPRVKSFKSIALA
jgi:phosphatidylethanolamine-binding protein (PEBP) family uncharacterized protein